MSKQLTQARLAEIARNSAQRKVVSIDGYQTAYWYYPARAKQRNKRSIIFIHGYRGNHHGLEAIAGAIENSEIYIPDLPGFGESEPFSSNHNIDHYASWLNDFIVALNLKSKPHLLGHSFGSIVVSAYAASFDGIETLILENPVANPALKGPKALMTGIAKAFFWLAGALPENAGNAILKSWPMVRGMSIVMTKSRLKELRRWVHLQHDENFNDFASRRVALEGYSASISNCVSDYAHGFRVPVLMLVGQRDDITTVTQQRKLHASLPIIGSEILEFKKVGHLTHYEIPTEIGQSIERWAEKHD